MRVLIIGHSDAPWTPYFARSFEDRGWHTKVVSMAPRPIPDIDMEFIGVEPFDKSRNKFLFVSSVPRVRRIIRSFRPDVVLAPYLSSNGLLAALSGAAPLAVAAVGGDIFDYRNRSRLATFFREASIKWVCRRAVLINTVARNLTTELLRLGVAREKLLELNFGADTRRFQPRDEPFHAGPIRLICTRKHEPVYDIDTIIDGLERLEDRGHEFHCTFLGDGSLLDRHKSRVRDAGLESSVRFLGHQDHEAVPAILRQADIYISSTHSDGTSVSLLEAMASGLFPVVTGIEANRPWIEDGENGLLFEPGNSEGLAQALVAAIDAPHLRQTAADHNRRTVERCGDMHANLDILARALEKLVSVSDGNR